MKPKLITIDARATVDALLAKAVKAIKSKSGYLAHHEANTQVVAEHGKHVHYCEIIIETNIPEWVVAVICAEVIKLEYADLYSYTSSEGHFDWAADTYIKPSAIVHFKMHPTF